MNGIKINGLVHGTLKHLDGTSTVEIFAFIKAVIRYRVDCILYIDQYETRIFQQFPLRYQTIFCVQRVQEKERKREHLFYLFEAIQNNKDKHRRPFVWTTR